NNPTVEQAERVAAFGVENCTTNPAYGSKVLPRLTDADTTDLVREITAAHSDVDEAVDEIQCRLVADILPAFRPAYDASGGRSGFVSIQPNPFRDDDADFILSAAERHRAVGPNVINKIPATAAGITAMRRLFRDGHPVIATEMFSVAQTRAVCEAYIDAAEETGKHPVLFITHITGIYEEFIAENALGDHPEIDAPTLSDACFALARRVHGVMNGYDAGIILLGGGARMLHHLTDYVGSDMHVTVNPGDIDKLNEADSVEMDAFDRSVDADTVEMLRAVPEFAQAWNEEGLGVDEFQEYPPVQYFLGSFRKGWDEVRARVMAK
ncbi:MAG: transaldolase family protein, partial [bacterium]